MLEQGVTVFDADLRLVTWNKTFLHLLDFPDHLAQPGASFENFIRYNAERGEYGPGDPEAQIAERVAAARAFTPHYTERVRPNGQILAVRGMPLPHQGFIALYSDITQQRRAEERVAQTNAELEAHIQSRTNELTTANIDLQAAIDANRQITAALQRSEARLRQITDAIPAHIAYFDHSWTYRYANRRYAEWFGSTSTGMTDQPIEQAIGREMFEKVKDAVARALAGEQVTYEYDLTRPDGSVVYARSTLVPDVGAEGEVMGCFVHSLDITEQRRTQQAFAQAQKMEAIGQLTGGLAHDFNNMLTVIIGNLTGLREAHPDDPASEEFIEPAMQAAIGGAELIRRLLTFSRQQPLAPRRVEVNQLVLNMSKLIRRSLPANISLVTANRQPELETLVDPHQLESALLNLALNARDAMPNGGELRIESSLETLSPAAAADLELAPGDYVQIAVHDNGTGMDGGTLARVFEPFFTTKKFGMGSGLGLAMVYGFIKQSGGGVRIRSRQARGTTIALVLPLAPCGADAPADEAAPPADPVESFAGKLVLLVDDDAEVRKVVRKQLGAIGCVVLEAENGQEGADMVENVPAIALVISDVVMPGGMDGRALARFVRRFRAELPVILMSGFADQADPRDAEAPPLLAKPFSRAKLLTALQALPRRD
ncbi:MAG: PAS-domain containing protein [Zoogloeaceae bacterium]|nr:PAS-domain containing protein [Zoogloeaceae bacterium]